jgi:hypothetical protein
MKLEMMMRMFKDKNEKINLGGERRGRPPGSKAKKKIETKNMRTFYCFHFGNQIAK